MQKGYTPCVICGHILNLSSLVKKFSAKRIARTVGREMTDEILYNLSGYVQNVSSGG